MKRNFLKIQQAYREGLQTEEGDTEEDEQSRKVWLPAWLKLQLWQLCQIECCQDHWMQFSLDWLHFDQRAHMQQHQPDLWLRSSVHQDLVRRPAGSGKVDRLSCSVHLPGLLFDGILTAAQTSSKPAFHSLCHNGRLGGRGGAFLTIIIFSKKTLRRLHLKSF